MAVEFTMINGNPFPLYNDAPLSWSIGLYHTFAEEEAGFPKARTVIRAMRVRRPDQLEQERASYLRASFDRMFGHNAKRMLTIIDDELSVKLS